MADIRELVQTATPPVDDVDLDALHRRAATVRTSDRRRHRLVFTGVAGALVLVVGLAAAPLLGGAPERVEVAVGQGRPSPFDGVSGPSLLGGGDVALGDFAGRPVVAFVWAGWCGACPAVLPDLDALAAAHPDVAVVTISVLDSTERARGILADAGFSQPSLHLDDAQPLSELLQSPEPQPIATLDGQAPVMAVPDGDMDGLRALPVTFALDADHQLVDTYLGPPAPQVLEVLAAGAQAGAAAPPTAVPTASPEFPIITVPATPSPGMPNVVPSPLPDPGIRTYEVQPGDTLSTIAEAVYGDPLAFAPIAEANGVGGDNALQVGQVLGIPERSVPDQHDTGGASTEIGTALTPRLQAAVDALVSEEVREGQPTAFLLHPTRDSEVPTDAVQRLQTANGGAGVILGGGHGAFITESSRDGQISTRALWWPTPDGVIQMIVGPAEDNAKVPAVDVLVQIADRVLQGLNGD